MKLCFLFMGFFFWPYFQLIFSLTFLSLKACL